LLDRTLLLCSTLPLGSLPLQCSLSVSLLFSLICTQLLCSASLLGRLPLGRALSFRSLSALIRALLLLRRTTLLESTLAGGSSLLRGPLLLCCAAGLRLILHVSRRRRCLALAQPDAPAAPAGLGPLTLWRRRRPGCGGLALRGAITLFALVRALRCDKRRRSVMQGPPVNRPSASEPPGWTDLKGNAVPWCGFLLSISPGTACGSASAAKYAS
jgi:hypothetical protein